MPDKDFFSERRSILVKTPVASRPCTWEHDPTLSATGRAHATKVGRNLAKEPLVKFDAVVSSPYRRCIETAVLICKKLGVPLAIDPQMGEVQNASVMGYSLSSCENAEGLFRPISENVAYAKGHSVAVIGIEDLCGPASDELPAWPEVLPRAFRRYANAFEHLVSSGKSIFCVTHAYALLSIGSRFGSRGHAITQALVRPGFGDFFVCSVERPIAGNGSQRFPVLIHSFGSDPGTGAKDDVLRTISSPARERVAKRLASPSSSPEGPISPRQRTPRPLKPNTPLNVRRGNFLMKPLNFPSRSTKVSANGKQVAETTPALELEADLAESQSAPPADVVALKLAKPKAAAIRSDAEAVVPLTDTGSCTAVAA
jgi:broad specificity phosphatase PhoE